MSQFPYFTVQRTQRVVVGNPNIMVKCSSVNLKSRTNADFHNVLINKCNLWNEFRNNFLCCNYLCFGRDSGFLAAVRYVLFVFISKRRERMENCYYWPCRGCFEKIFEANQPSKDNKKVSLLILKHTRLVLLFTVDGYCLWKVPILPNMLP